ncbi:MAG: TlpA family protein disulfide reductase [Verrucomicrobia bacterium]|nr:TlpA family protein disulfide reductase [Verrucomicrobiota bacterium]
MKIRLHLLALALATLAPLASAATAPARPPLLANGTDAPDFTALRPDNTPVKLADFRGQVVLVDFWSTWCGPCKATMPHMEKLHQKLAVQGLVVLGVCVWDERAKFDGWLTTPQVPTSYLKVFDPAARNSANSIARKLYRVSGIPTFYLVDREGKILFSGVGSGPATEKALDKALAAAGFKL